MFVSFFIFTWVLGLVCFVDLFGVDIFCGHLLYQVKVIREGRVIFFHFLGGCMMLVG